MHFKESKQMVYGMICREGKGKREMMQFYYKIKNNLKNVIHVCGGLGPVPVIWLASSSQEPPVLRLQAQLAVRS